MRFRIALITSVVTLLGCSKTEKRFWDFEVVIPSEFILSETDVGNEWRWRTQDNSLEIGHLRFSAERSAYATLDDFAVLAEEPGFRPKPTFRRAPNGLDIAVDLTVQGWTQIAVSNPENTEYWEVFLYGISPGDPSVRGSRLLRETALGAILSGRPTQN